MTELNSQGLEETALAVLPNFGGAHEPCVYFVANGNRIKIGYTENLARRVVALAQLRESIELVLAGGYDLEAALHRRFAHIRVGASEWFRYTTELRAYVTSKRSASGIEKNYPFWEPEKEEINAELVEGDPLFVAAHLVTSMGKASASMLQRRLHIRFTRASQLLDDLQELGVVGPCGGPGRSRSLLLRTDQLSSVFGR